MIKITAIDVLICLSKLVKQFLANTCLSFTVENKTKYHWMQILKLPQKIATGRLFDIGIPNNFGQATVKCKMYHND